LPLVNYLPHALKSWSEAQLGYDSVSYETRLVSLSSPSTSHSFPFHESSEGLGESSGIEFGTV